MWRYAIYLASGLLGAPVLYAQSEAAPEAPSTEEATEQESTDTSASAGENTEASEESAEGLSAAEQDAAQQENFRLRDIESRVDNLKEKIYRSKVRLLQLQEVVIRGAVKGSQLIMVHRNEMGSSFRLARIQYALDGAVILNRTDSGEGELNEVEEIEVFNGSVTPGDHQLSVYLEYQGHGYGVFSYLQGYTFKLKSSYVFTAQEGKLTTIYSTGYEKGKLTTKLEDRPAVKYDMEVTRDIGTGVTAEDAADAAEADAATDSE